MTFEATSVRKKPEIVLTFDAPNMPAAEKLVRLNHPKETFTIKVEATRYVVDMGNDKVGKTHFYADEENLNAMKLEIAQQGYTILKTEKKFI